MVDDKFILSELKKAFRRNAMDEVVDLDDRFIHNFDFHIYRFEDVLMGMNGRIPPNKWSFYRIGLILEGSGDFITGIYNYTATKDTLIVIPAHVITSSKNWAADTRGYIMVFNIDFFLQNRLPHKYIEGKKILTTAIQPYVHLTKKQSEEIAAIFETILKEKQVKKAFKEELIALKVIELIIMSERLFDKEQHFEANMPSIDIIKRFIDLLEANFYKERSVRFYAEQLSLHPNYLNSLIKTHTGLTAKESIQNRLILETKYLLHSTSLTIKEISGQVGFNDPNYFTSFFTKVENMSPGKYRSQFI